MVNGIRGGSIKGSLYCGLGHMKVFVVGRDTLVEEVKRDVDKVAKERLQRKG